MKTSHKHRTRRVRWVILICLATVAAGFRSGVASALDCTSPVVDTSGVMQSFDKELATKAATDLQNQGADPYARFIDRLPNGTTIDEYESQLVKSCKTMQSATPGQRKNNLVLLIVAIKDRKAVLAWGERWNNALEGESDRIRADFLNPYLRDSNWGTAVKATFNEVGRTIEAALHPKPAGPTIVNEAPDKPTDLTILWVLLIGAAGIGLVAVVIYGGTSLYNRRKAIEVARAKAIEARDAAAEAITAMSTAHDDYGEALQVAALGANTDEKEQLHATSTKVDEQVRRATTLYSDLHGEQFDPTKSHSAKEYAEIEQRYHSANGGATVALSTVNEAKRGVDELIELKESLPGRIDALKRGLEALKRSIFAVKKDGFKTDALDSRLAGITGNLDKAELGLHTGRPIHEVDELAETVHEDAEKLAKFTQRLPAYQKELQTHAKQLLTWIEESVKQLQQARQVFNEISVKYAEASWQSIRGNGSSAEALLTEASALTTEALHLGSMEKQEWEACEAKLADAKSKTGQASDLIVAIGVRAKALAEAEQHAARDLTAAESDIAAAKEFVAQHDEELAEAYEADLATAEGWLIDGRKELRRAKPDYLKTMELAKNAHQHADAVLDRCRDDVEQLARLRAREQAAQREALRTIKEAGAYISSHPEATSAAEWQDAKTLFANGDAIEVAAKSHETAHTDQAEALTLRVGWFEQATAQAAAALQQAMDDVREAEEEAARLRRQRQPATSDYSYSSPSYSSPSFTDYGGGGGSSSGGFGDGGGGSSSGGW